MNYWENSLNNFFFKFLISLRIGHGDCSPRTTPLLNTTLEEAVASTYKLFELLLVFRKVGERAFSESAVIISLGNFQNIKNWSTVLCCVRYETPCIQADFLRVIDITVSHNSPSLCYSRNSHEPVRCERLRIHNRMKLRTHGNGYWK